MAATKTQKKTVAPADVPTSFESPDSKLIARAIYVPGQETMGITFQDGKTYGYQGISEALWAEFTQATSKGAFFSGRIRPMFAGTRQQD